MTTTETPQGHEPVETAALPAGKTQKLLPAHAGDPVGQKKGGSSWRKLALVVFLLAVTALAIYIIRKNKQEQKETAAKAVQAANRPIPVTVSPVASRTMAIYLTELGTVTAYNTVTVKSRVDGQLLSVNVREGQQVRQGQVLAMIDPRPYQAVVAQAEGTLAKDEAAAANSKAEAARYTALYEAGVVSKETEQLQVSTANQTVGIEVADRAAIQAAKVNVAYTRITSPINGVVGLRQVDAGNIVHAADANGLLVVTQLQPIAVIFTLPEDSLQQVLKMVRSGKKLVVEAFDRSQTTHLASGSLLTVDNQIDTTTGTVKVKAVFDNKDGALFPNQFVNVRLVLEERQNSLVVPAAAIQTGTGGTFVYVVRPGEPPAGAGAGRHGKGGKATGDAQGASASPDAAKAGGKGKGGTDDAAPRQDPYYVERVNVTVDLTEGSNVILRNGVKAGDQVVIDGEEKLTEGKMVVPKQGKSNSGGPSTQPIGSTGSSAADGTPQPASPEQGKPDAGMTTTGPKQPRDQSHGQTGGNGGGRQ